MLTRLTDQSVRRRLYGVAFAAVTLATGYGLLTQVEAALWAGLLSAVAALSMATINAHNWRVWLYGIAAAAQPLAVHHAVTTDTQAALWLGLLAALIGIGTARVTTGNGPPCIGCQPDAPHGQNPELIDNMEAR